MPRLMTQGVRFERFESDCDVLRFPQGGVHAASARPATENRFRIGVPDAVSEVTRTLARMQEQLNRLRDEVGTSLTETWPPKAA